MSLIPAICPVHVGRGAEIGQLEDAADRRSVTFIAGDAGVGKTRMGREAVRLARERQLATYLGNCSPDATVPYAPFVTAIRRHCRSLGLDDLKSLFVGSALLAANLLPEVAKEVGSSTHTPNQEDLFAAVWQLVRRLAGDGGCLLLLEDLHWADEDSLRLLAYLVREIEGLGLWLVGTYRSDEMHRRHPLAMVLSELNRERRYLEISLRPLDPESLRQMVSEIFDRTEVGDEFVAALSERTLGNPFFVEELVKVLLDDGAIFRQSDDWARRDLLEIEMPVTVREALLIRTRTLSPSTVEALQVAAVLGERIDLAILERITGMSPSQVEELINEGIGLQLIVERREGANTVYGFRHALTREALADEVVGPARQRVHLRIAEALSSRHADDPDAVASELAEHFAEAGDVEASVHFGLRAARRAVSSMALTEAGGRYDGTLRLMGTDHEDRLDVLLEAAEAVLSHDDRLAKSFAADALGLSLAHQDRVGQSRALLILGRCAWRSGDSQQAIRFSVEAREATRDLDDHQEAVAIAYLARVLTLSDRHAEAAALLQEGIPLAARTGDDRALSIMYGTRMLQTVEGPVFEEALEAAVAAAKRVNDLTEESTSIMNAGYICLWTGDLLRSERHLLEGIKLAERAMPADRYATAGLAWLLSLMGRLDEAKGIAAPLAASSLIPTRIVALTALCEVAERQGGSDLPDLVDQLWSDASQTGEAQRSVPALAARAALALRQGSDEAIPIFKHCLASTTNNRGMGAHWMFSPDLARALAEDGRVEELDRWYRDIHELTRADPNAHNRAADEICRGYLLMLEEDSAEAVAAFRAAREAFERMPYPARECEALLALADHLWRTDCVADSLSASREAAGIAERIGAVSLSKQAVDLVSRASTPSVLTTVMFTDIVGSTERLSSVGDRAWKSLIERHNTLVRRELSRWKGREIDTTGDGFLAAFDSPASGVRCALSIRDNLAKTGIEIRAGLHTGECQLSGTKLSGLTVHIAARISALAGAREVLVSGTVQDLVIGSSLRFEDRGLQELKGVPGRWRLAVVSAS